jgi:RNA polymerase sigma-B factor
MVWSGLRGGARGFAGTGERIDGVVTVADLSLRPAGSDRPTTVPAPGADPPPSGDRQEYAEFLPLLDRYAALPGHHPDRGPLRDELVVAFLPVVRNLARRYSRGGIVEDLEQVGTIGLINAIDRYDPARGSGSFLGYLIPTVTGEIRRYFRDRTWSTRVPRSLKELAVRIDRCTEPLSHRLGRAPKPSELAAELGVGKNEIIDALAARESRHGRPLDTPYGDEGRGLSETLGELDAEFEHVERHEILRPLVEALPARERTILMLRFFEDRTQTEIADRLGISQMHVSRLLTRTLAQLRQQLRDAGQPTMP